MLISLQSKLVYEKKKRTKIKEIRVGNRVYTMSEDDFVKLKKFRQNENT